MALVLEDQPGPDHQLLTGERVAIADVAHHCSDESRNDGHADPQLAVSSSKARRLIRPHLSPGLRAECRLPPDSG